MKTVGPGNGVNATICMRIASPFLDSGVHTIEIETSDNEVLWQSTKT
jgi:hypothetical protein